MLDQSLICIVQSCYNFAFYQLPKNELKSPNMIGDLSLTLYSFSLLLLVFLPLSISFSFFVSFSVYVFISLCGCAQLLSHVWLFVTPWTVACQAPLSMEFLRQECWSELPCPPPEDLPTLGLKHVSPVSPVLESRLFTIEPLGKPIHIYSKTQNTCFKRIRNLD